MTPAERTAPPSPIKLDPSLFIWPINEWRQSDPFQPLGYDLSKLLFTTSHLETHIPVNPAQPQQRGSEWLLPQPGIYHGVIGDQQLVLIGMPEDYEHKIRIAFDFISGMTSGKPHGNSEMTDDAHNILSRIFLNPVLRHWNCGPTATILMTLLSFMNVYSRRVHWINPSATKIAKRHHVVLEIWHLHIKQWQLMDTHCGFMFAPGFSAVLFLIAEKGTNDYLSHIQHAFPKSHLNQLQVILGMRDLAKVMSVEENEKTIATAFTGLTDIQKAELAADHPNMQLLSLTDFCNEARYIWP